MFDVGNERIFPLSVAKVENCLTRQVGLFTPSTPNGRTKLSSTLLNPSAACAKGPSGTQWPKPSPPMEFHSRAVCKGRVQSQ
eukprot:scaffold86873_cov72-Phaeocystis_antarctica.AAC.1